MMGFFFRGRGRGYVSGHGRSSHQSASDSSTLTYYNCRGQGHTSRQCPSLKFSDNNVKPTANFIASPSVSPKP